MTLAPRSGSAADGTRVVVHGQNLGCPLAVAFGSSEAEWFTPAEALLACGSTTSLHAVSPPGATGARVPVTVTTLEGYFTGGGNGPTKALFTYTSP